MTEFLAIMQVPVLVTLDVEHPSPEEKSRLEEHLQSQMAKEGWGGGTLQELILAPGQK